MASTTPTTRRVLSDLNVNTPTARGALHIPKGTTTSPAKPRKVGEILLSATLEAKMSGQVFEDGVGSTKRRSNLSLHDISSRKRNKTGHSKEFGVEKSVQGPYTHQGNSIRQDDTSTMQSKASLYSDDNDEVSSSSSSSPSSSLGSVHLASLNDSQVTTITEPDDIVPLHDTSFLLALAPPRIGRPMTREQLREKAREMKLRLKLASYKVRTNQIDIPMSCLEIRSISSHRSPELPPHPRRRTPLPSTSNVPDIYLQKPSAEKKKKQTYITDIPSSPPHVSHDKQAEKDDPRCPTKKDEDKTRKGLPTPLLPRQHDSFLTQPNLNTPFWDSKKNIENDLSSSVVKGRAADGLLSLKRHQN